MSRFHLTEGGRDGPRPPLKPRWCSKVEEGVLEGNVQLLKLARQGKMEISWQMNPERERQGVACQVAHRPGNEARWDFFSPDSWKLWGF